MVFVVASGSSGITSIGGAANPILPSAEPTNLSGTLSGTELPLTLTVPAGGVPGFPDCSISGSGVASADSNEISGFLNITFTSCDEFADQPTETDRLSLTKQ